MNQIKADSQWGGLGNRKAIETLVTGHSERYTCVVKGERVSKLQGGAWGDSWRQSYSGQKPFYRTQKEPRMRVGHKGQLELRV